MSHPTEFGRIDRELHIEAEPDVVFEVISRPEHLREWWPDDARLDEGSGAQGELIWNGDQGSSVTVPIKVVRVEPPHLFQFRWAYEAGTEPSESNSFLVTFELEPSSGGTRLRFSETGFREQGWQVAQLEAAYHEHAEGWDLFLPRLKAYVPRVVAS